MYVVDQHQQAQANVRDSLIRASYYNINMDSPACFKWQCCLCQAGEGFSIMDQTLKEKSLSEQNLDVKFSPNLQLFTQTLISSNLLSSLPPSFPPSFSLPTHS